MSAYSFLYKSYRIPFVANSVIGIYLPTVNLSSSKLRRLNLFNQPFMPVPGDELVRTDDIFNNYTIQLYSDQTQCESDELKSSTNKLPEVTNNKYTTPFLKGQGDNIMYVGKCISSNEILEVNQELEANQTLVNDEITTIINRAYATTIKLVDADIGYQNYLELYNPQPDTQSNEFRLLYKVIYDYRYAVQAQTTWTLTFPIEVKQFLENLNIENQSTLASLGITNTALLADINKYIDKMNTLMESIRLIDGFTARPTQADLTVNPEVVMDDDIIEALQGNLPNTTVVTTNTLLEQALDNF